MKSGPKPRPAADRFWEKVRKGDGCWLWTGSKLQTGYGSFYVDRDKGKCRAHRVSWEMHYCFIPAGLFVLHRCDVRLCVRPDHLYLGSHAINMRDLAVRGRPGRNAKKLTAAEVREIRGLRGTAPQSVLAQRFGVTQPIIQRILARKIWASA